MTAPRFFLSGKEIPEKAHSFTLFPVYIEIWNPINEQWLRYFDEAKDGRYLNNVLIDFFSPKFGNVNYLSSKPELGAINGFSWLRLQPMTLSINLIHFDQNLIWLRKLATLVQKKMNTNTGAWFLADAEWLTCREAQRTLQQMKERIEKQK